MSCPNGHEVSQGQQFCPSCGTPLASPKPSSWSLASLSESADESASETTSNPKAGPQRLWMTAIGAAVVVALAVVILIAATSSGSNSDRPQQASPPLTTSPQDQCVSDAVQFAGQALRAISIGEDPTSIILGAASTFGMNSPTYKAGLDAYEQTSTILFQEGSAAAAKLGARIVQQDCA